MQPSETLSLTLATPAEAPQIRLIAEEAWPVTFGDILTPEFIAHELKREYSDTAIRQQMAKGHQFLLIHTDTGPVGYASYQHLGKKTKLHKLYLRPNLKGQGLGYRLTLAVEEAARAAGTAAVELLVNRDNPSIAFYERQGYIITGSLDTPVSPEFTREDYVMRKSLA